MEHTNLFLYETEADFLVDYPDGKVNEPVPAAVYIRGAEGELGTMHTNKEITTYTITIHSQNKTGETVAPDKTMQTPPVLDGNTVKVNIVAEPVEGYKPRHEVEKATFSGNSGFTIIYLEPTTYTVTVNHMSSGESIAEATEIIVDDVYDEDVVRVRIEPLLIPGYTASPVTISVSGDMTYNLEYVVSGPSYESVDLGLPSGTKWANMNIGASNPEEYGNYYACGEIEPKETTAYTDEGYRFYNNGNEYTKYNTTDNKMTLDLEDDAANVVMGGDWHIPTSAQCAELLDNTTSSWTTDYNGTGVAGLIFTSISNRNSIFFPAAGVIYNGSSMGSGEWFAVSSSSANDLESFFGVSGRPNGCSISPNPRYAGVSVRGVLGESPEPEPGPEIA